ncbi:MAG: cyclopropane-fatty-acyl-phospholipid synthase family protein [Planctomycetaceae bacterium]|nr:cyclopropane-fatty-acyl-phospholipid synthase family protein [Planctomycetaceae bacterium]
MSVATTKESESLGVAPAEATSCQTSSQLSWFDRFCSDQVLRRLQALHHGRLAIRFECSEAVVGERNETASTAIVNVHSPRFFRRIATEGGMGAAESYLDGEWSSPDLTSVFRTLIRNEDAMESMRSSRFSPWNLVRRLEHFRNRNSKDGSRRNIHEHYDLGNEFFSLFLDETMMYSSAVFPTPEATLKEASTEKIDRVCRTLQLTPNDHIVEIGTGWGGFACHAAANYGCRVTTTTISQEQHDFAAARIQQMGLQDRVTLLMKDYRDLTGTYDKLVSLEMIEAVGREYMPEYFSTCNRLVKDDGAMMIQAITIPEQRYEAYSRSVDFIQKYIFPGGFLPSIESMQQCVRTQTKFRMLDLQDFGMHYAATLNCWNEAFHDRLEEVRAQGFSERFIRMWRYYLCYCEAAFLERATGLVQTLWAKPGCELGRKLQSV